MEISFSNEPNLKGISVGWNADLAEVVRACHRNKDQYIRFHGRNFFPNFHRQSEKRGCNVFVAAANKNLLLAKDL